MEILNKISPQLAKMTLNRDKPHVSFANKRAIYFPATTANEFGMAPGAFIQFVLEPDRLYFYVSYDPTGFSIGKGWSGEYGQSVRIHNRALIEALKKKIHRAEEDQ